MNNKPGPISGSWLLTTKVHADARGQFVESFQKGVFAEQTHLSIDFVQDNEVVSRKGVIRGLHLQNVPHGQAKLIRVVHGQIYDVAVDLRKDSSTWRMVWCGALQTKPNCFYQRALLMGIAC